MDLQLLKNFLTQAHQPDYRYRQIVKNYFSARYQDFNSMTDLPLSLRSDLASNIFFSEIKDSRIVNYESTQKALLTLQDGKQIETVLMNYDNWLTVCVSTQVGCPMGCTFCATGKMGFIRNLTADEIAAQILFWNQHLYPSYVGRVVYMGMGEPFVNWENTLTSLDIVNSKDKLNIGARKISISTSGIVPKIKQFADLDNQVNLAVSLHSAVQSTRSTIMPVTKTYPLSDLLDVCQYYVNKTHRQLFFEYSLINMTNDTENEIQSLIKLIKSNKLFFLNLIPLNPVAGGLVPTTSVRLRQITQTLDRNNVPYTLRRSFGSPIHAACGQLATTAAK